MSQNAASSSQEDAASTKEDAASTKATQGSVASESATGAPQTKEPESAKYSQERLIIRMVPFVDGQANLKFFQEEDSEEGK